MTIFERIHRSPRCLWVEVEACAPRDPALRRKDDKAVKPRGERSGDS